jgi:hypothetical protein
VLEAEGERVFEVGEIAASDAVDAPVAFIGAGFIESGAASAAPLGNGGGGRR